MSDSELFRPRSATRPPNIVTVVLDCARAKNFGCVSGQPVARTPVMDGLAAKGTTFCRAVAPSNWTVPSHFSIFTGVYPNVHGVRTFQRASRANETTASYLKDRGYDTILLSENPLVGVFGSESGFVVRRSGAPGEAADERSVVKGFLGRFDRLKPQALVRPLSRFPYLIAPLNLIHRQGEVSYKRQVCNETSVDYFGDWYSHRRDDRPFYAFFNFVDTHSPHAIASDATPLSFMERTYLYTPRFFLLAIPGIRSRMRWDVLLQGYLAGIESADRKIGRLVKLLDQIDELGRTLLIVTSDHGESFGECDYFYHGTGAPDSVTRVPLVVVPPGPFKPPKSVERWVSLCEIDSWIKAAAAGLPPYDVVGHAPAPFLSEASNAPAVFCEGAPASDSIRSLKGFRTDQPWNQRLLAAYRENEKFVLNLDTHELAYWASVEDPDSASPGRLSSAQAALVRREIFGGYEYQDSLSNNRAREAAGSTSVEIDQRLRSWGYD